MSLIFDLECEGREVEVEISEDGSWDFLAESKEKALLVESMRGEPMECLEKMRQFEEDQLSFLAKEGLLDGLPWRYLTLRIAQEAQKNIVKGEDYLYELFPRLKETLRIPSPTDVAETYIGLIKRTIHAIEVGMSPKVATLIVRRWIDDKDSQAEPHGLDSRHVSLLYNNLDIHSKRKKSEWRDDGIISRQESRRRLDKIHNSLLTVHHAAAANAAENLMFYGMTGSKTQKMAHPAFELLIRNVVYNAPGRGVFSVDTVAKARERLTRMAFAAIEDVYGNDEE